MMNCWAEDNTTYVIHVMNIEIATYVLPFFLWDIAVILVGTIICSSVIYFLVYENCACSILFYTIIFHLIWILITVFCLSTTVTG